MGYSDKSDMGYKVYVLELKEVVVGVYCLFNEVIPTYREECYNELSKLQIDMTSDEHGREF